MIGPREIHERACRAFGQPRNPRATRELRFGRKGSVSVVLDGPKAGLWYDFEDGRGGTLLDIDEMPDRPHRPPARRAREPIDRPEQRHAVEAMLARITSVEGSPGEVYLRGRGISRWPHSIRFLPNPLALACLAQDLSGAVRAIQRIYLRADGSRGSIMVAGVETRKTTHATCDGWHEIAAVRMPGRGLPILCEGVETGLSIWMATGRPVCACLGNAGFDSLYVRGKSVCIARDGDRPGSKADKRIGRALDARCRTHRVLVATPPVAMDFNDAHQAHGLDEVASIIKGAKSWQP